MHLIAPEQNVIGMSAVVGTTIPVAVGYALALKREGKGRVAVVFMGDGATEEGVFYESINFAKLHRLPILFVCENNGYAIHTPLSKRWAATTICERVAGFGLPTKRIEDGDIFAIRNYAGEAISTMRQNDVGPAFLECLTYRWLEHVGPNEDFHLGYRSEAERHWWKERDAVAQVASLIDPELRQSIDQRIEMQIEEAVRFAEESPFPGPKELTRYVFAEDASCDN
jgi:pyruvate dehydrogenase E1 component alpha subunit